MIPLTDVGWQSQNWQWQLQHSITDARELAAAVDLDLADVPHLHGFPLFAPRPFVARMERGNPADPLLRQVLPATEELVPKPGFSKDPLAETASGPNALLHKYEGRVLVVTTGKCAIHCRYCFRRHFPYGDTQPGTAEWERIFEYIGADDSISEVILSGGDPLVLPDRRLAAIVMRLGEIEHLTTVRLHTRLPIMIPNRVCDELIEWIRETRLQTVVVLHANHANEFDTDVEAAIERLRSAGAVMLNQSVLLRGINDNADALTSLSRTLFERGVLPYYLHLLDPVAGAAHFEVNEEQAKVLVRDIASRLPGYLVPRLVREEPGTPSKQLKA